MANKEGHRRFGNVRKLPSGRYQIRYPGPDGRTRTGPETYERKSDADKALVIVEAQMTSGTWTDPERGKVKLGDYAATWIAQRAGLRPRTVDLYRWLLKKHIEPYIGGVPVGKMSTRLVREWRATLLTNGVSVSMAAKAYRLLRAVMTTAVEDDNMLPRNPCRIKGAGDEHAEERPVLTVRQVFDLADIVGRRPVGNIRKVADGYRLRFSRNGVMRTSPERFSTRLEAERALWKLASEGRADCTHDRRFRCLVLLTAFTSLRWGEATALRRADVDLKAGTVRVRAAYIERSTGEMLIGPPKSKASRRVVGIPHRDHLRPDHAPTDLRQGRAGRTGVPRRPGRADPARQLQQDVGLAASGRIHRHARASFPRSSTHWKPVRSQQRCGPARPDGPHGPRLRAGRDDLPARGTRRGQDDH
jgi:integrase